MGNLVGLDLFLEVKTDGHSWCYCSPTAQTRIHQITSRKSELITSPQAPRCRFSETDLYLSILGYVSGRR
jgi:hypothetical protein